MMFAIPVSRTNVFENVNFVSILMEVFKKQKIILKFENLITYRSIIIPQP